MAPLRPANDRLQGVLVALEALIADLDEQLAEDGLEKRARTVSRTLSRRDHQLEGMRLAALTAHAFGGVSAARRRVLELLVHGFGLDSGVVDQAIQEAEASLASGQPERRRVAAYG